MTEKTLIDFNNLDAGTIVGDQFAASGVRISNINADGSVNTNNPPMIFDAEQDPSGRVSGGDDDLLKEGAGGILIASEDGDSSDPDDNAGGACFRFDFESTTSVNSITMVDVERGAVIEVFDADGNLLKRLDVRTEDGEHVDFDIDVDGAAYMLVGINGSGGVDNLAFTPALQPDGIVNGTAQGELIETGFTDEQGDKIDSNDALGVEGTTGDDDLVLAGAGDDTVRAAEGDDIIRGEEGNDSLEGQNGDDTIEGGEGADTLIGGRGNDMLDGGSENDIIGGGSGDDMATGGDGNDRLVMGSGDDKADGEDGNDLVRGEAGEDTLFGGAGDDTVDGGSDDDLIYGDSNGQDGEPICGPRESFNWSEIDGYAEGVAVTTASQNTGTVEVTFSTLSENGGVTTEFEDDQIAVNGIDSGSETINDTSSLFSDLRNNGDNVTYEFDFATAVKGVSFNIADVDGNSVVTVRAFDADGNATDVVLEGGSKVDIDGNVADSQGGFSPDTDEDYAVNVAIDGPVSRIEILHAQDANGASGITVSDVFFDPIIGFTDEDGNDSLIGGDGADTIFGEGGDDTLDGGDGADELSGGDDQDTFVNVSVGDLIDGNEGGVDLDTLDLTGANAQVEFDDDNQENGTIFFLDGDGQRVDGDTARFLNIENVVGAVPINDDPDAVNDSVTLDEDTTVVIRPLDNDTDGNGDTLTITDVSDPANGTLVDNGDGTFTYEPNADFNGSDSFTYTVSDGNGGTDTATVNITVNPVNDDPVAETDTVSVDEDDSVVIDVLANDTDVDGDTLTIVSFGQGGSGTVTQNADGTLTYTPNAEYNGPDSFTYTVSDGQGGESTASVNITVDPLNDDPDATNDSVTVDEDESVTIDVLANDTDADSDTLTIVSFEQGGNGSVSQNTDGTLTYTPNADYNGSDSFTYTVDDGNGGTDTATVNITVNPVNDDPVAETDTVSVDEDDSVVIDVLANDTDVDGDTLTIVSFGQGGSGTVTQNADGTLTYTPNAEYNGPDSFTYTVSDGQGGESTASVNITVDPLNDDPDATNDSVTVDEDESVTIDVLANDTDADSDTLTIVSFEQGGNGSVSQNTDGTLTYTPNADYNGSDSFTYTVDDGNGGTDTATVNITVNPVNDDPVAETDTVSVDEDDSVVIDVLANDTDVDGDTLTIVSFGQGGSGTVTQNADGTLTYTPNADFNGPDSFTYTVSDGQGGESTASVNITVQPIGDPDGVVDGEGSGEEMLVGYDDSNDPTDGGGDLITDGDDVIEGNGGDDTIEAGGGNDTVSGGDDDDVIDGQEGNDVITGDDGDDTLGGGLGRDSLDGGTGDDSLEGGSGFDTLVGDDGDDTLDGGSGADDLDGGDGDDDLIGGGGLDTLEGGSGADTLDGGRGSDSLSGGDDDDEIDGGDGQDTILGGDGNDTIVSGDRGASDLGYPGIFTPDADPENDRDSVDGGAGDDDIFTGDDADTITGGDGDDTIDAGKDADEVDGGDGDDEIIGGEGSDTILAGDGDDTVFGGLGPNFPDLINIIDEPGAGNGDLVEDNGKDVIDGGDGNDLIFGEDDDDTLIGGNGDDTLDGGIDDDSLEGGRGDDSLIGGQGDDLLEGNSGDDTLEGGDGDDSLSGAANDDVLLGGAGNDTITGDGGNDFIDGGEGDDVIRSGNGEDTVDGGAGNDSISGGAEADMLSGGDDRDVFTNVNAGDMIDGGGGGDDFDTLDLRGDGVDFITYTSPDREDGVITFLDGGTAKFEEIENVIPCFTPGTLIATPMGEVPVEGLVAGDRVITRDNGIQVIRWVGAREMQSAEMVENPAFCPVMIRQGALGHGLPERDMIVSPQHRVLIANDETMLYFDEREVLVAAKHLVGRPGIERMDAVETTYVHVMFDNHEVILSDGAWTESFQPGDQTLGGLAEAQRAEILAIFPELSEAEGREAYVAARRSLKRREAELLVK